MFWKSLGFFFAEDFTMLGIFWRDFWVICFLSGSYGGSAEQYAFDWGYSWFVYRSWHELCFGRVACFKYDW